MPGAMQLCEGVIVERRDVNLPFNAATFYDVEGLQELLEKWVGRRVSIIVEECSDD